MRQLVVAGVRTPVREAGTPGDEAVVFVHGNPGSGADWEGLLAAAGEFAYAVAPDMPGFGGAEKPRGFEYTVGGYAAHLQATLDELGIRRVHLVLHDFGGPWGLEWAAAHPDALASLTLVNTGALQPYRWHRLARIWQTPVLGELFMATGSRPVFKKLVNAENPRPFPDAFLDRMYDDFDRDTKRAVLKLYRASRDPEVVGARHGEALRRIAPSALVVWGVEDRYVPVELARRQLDFLPGAQLVEIAGAGHWPMIDAADQVAGAVIPFLKASVAAAAASGSSR